MTLGLIQRDNAIGEGKTEEILKNDSEIFNYRLTSGN